MNLIPWRNKSEERVNGGTGLSRMRTEMDQLFDHFFHDPWGSMMRMPGATAGGMLLDVSETDTAVTVTAELPGVDPKDVDIDVAGNMLTIRGEKKQEHEEKDRNYHFVERSFGRFQRSVQLPGSVDPDKVDAVCKNGTLTVTLTKRPDAQRKKIEIKGG